MSETTRSKGELEFIDQYARSLTVAWATQCISGPGEIPDTPGVRDTPYFRHAVEKGWITKKEPRRLTAKGFQTAASYLKR
jgi:hypothetical protein